jgi:transposase
LLFSYKVQDFVHTSLVFDVGINFYELHSEENFSKFVSSEAEANPPKNPNMLFA